MSIPLFLAFLSIFDLLAGSKLFLVRNSYALTPPNILCVLLSVFSAVTSLVSGQTVSNASI